MREYIEIEAPEVEFLRRGKLGFIDFIGEKLREILPPMYQIVDEMTSESPFNRSLIIRGHIERLIDRDGQYLLFTVR